MKFALDIVYHILYISSMLARFLAGCLFLGFASQTALPQQLHPLRVYISVDMEGIGGFLGGEPDREDYQQFRRFMTEEVNAAIQGSLDAGAKYILVEEHHGGRGFRNILLDELNPAAELIRGWPRPGGGITGMSADFPAAMFVGYHAKAGTKNAVDAHTFLGSVKDIEIDGHSVGEGGFNATVAGAYGVPVVLITGDDMVCQEMKDLLGNVECAVVKRALSLTAAVVTAPEDSTRLIRETAYRALRNLPSYHPLRLSTPYRAEIVFNQNWDERIERIATQHPEILRPAPRTLACNCRDVKALVDFYVKALDIGLESPPMLGRNPQPQSVVRLPDAIMGSKPLASTEFQPPVKRVVKERQ